MRENRTYGSEGGEPGNRASLPLSESSNGIQILDLNQDQRLDLIVHNHLKDGDHTFGSYIYWGRQGGFSTLHRTHLPTVGTHHAMAITPGSIYDRSLRLRRWMCPKLPDESRWSGRVRLLGELRSVSTYVFRLGGRT